MIAGGGVLEVLTELLRQTLDLDRGEPLSGATRLAADLGMTSIDFVAYVEIVETHYGRHIPFAELLGSLAEREQWDVTLEALAEFVAPHLGRR